MHKLILVLFVSSFSIAVNAQSHKFGTVNLTASYDAGAQIAYYNEKYNGNTIGDEDTTGAFTSLFRFDGHFNIFNFLSLGFNYRGGKFIEDSENTQAAGNKLGTYAFAVRIYPINKDKFVWYGGASIGLTTLEMNKKTDVFEIPYQYKFSGMHYGFETGVNWYFTGNLGLNFGLGYSGNAQQLKEFSFNGTEQNLDNWENILSSKGGHVNIGLTFHIGGN